MEDEGIRSRTQIQGQAPDGSLKNLRTDADGKILVNTGSSTGTQDVNVTNTSAIDVEITNNDAIEVEVSNSDPVPVTVSNDEKVLLSNVITAGTTATTVSVNAYVTTIEVANYSEDATVTLGVGNASVIIGQSIAAEIPINAEVTSISLTASAANTGVYYLIKGVINA